MTISIERKQQVILGLSIFLSLSAIACYSFDGQETQWVWQKAPMVAIGLMLLAFFLIRTWLHLELEKQKSQILQAFQASEKNAQDNFYNLLSSREIEVLKLISAGKSNKEIASTLYVALSTVKTHINNIYKILEVKNRREVLEKLQKVVREE